MLRVVDSSQIDQISSNIMLEAGHWPRVFTAEGIHPFEQIEWKIVDARIEGKGGNVVFEQKGVEVPIWWGQSAINIVADKYMRVINGVRENSVKQIFSRVASTIRKWATEQEYFNVEKDAQIFEEELIFALLHQYGAFNSPVWFNLGVPDRKQAASACFISSVEDTLDSIMNFQCSELKIFAFGSGSGANLSKIRSSYEKLSSGSYTSGPLSWMKGLDDYAGAMKSGGSTRNAAKMVVLDIDHPDILETKDGRPGFIKAKSAAEQIAHDLIQKAGYTGSFDDPNSAYKIVPLQNANNSISITNSFMQAVIDDGLWQTKERLTGKPVHTYKARDVWKEISIAAWKCADPGVQFNDTMNEWHTTPKSGKIRASNPCSEYLNIDNTACNLCAINLTKFFEGKKFNHERFEQSVRLFVTSQNAIIAKAEYPTDEITKNSITNRPIGLNYGDLGALLMKFGYGYDSDEGRAIAARMASLMTGHAYLTSARLAARVGAFEEFKDNRDDMMRIMRKHKEADSVILSRWNLENDPISDDVVSASSKLWDDVIDFGLRYGYSVSQATLQAPLGTISFLMEMNTTGIEPAFSLVSYKTMVGGGFMKLVNGAVRDALVNLGYSQESTEEICQYIHDNDCIEGAPGFKEEDLSVFDCAMPSGRSKRSLSPMAHIKMMAAIQPLITCAQSKTVNLPNSVTPEDIGNVYMEAWKLGLKCVALYRDGCKLSQPLATKERSDEQHDIKMVDEPRKDIELSFGAKRRPMPNDAEGTRHVFHIDGYKGYIIVNEYADKTPGEVFLRLGKPGSTVAGLIDGFTKLLSISLQFGVPLPKLIHSFVDTKFEPAGFTQNPNIRFAKSFYDYLFKYLDLKYYDGENTGLNLKKLVAEESESITPNSVDSLYPTPIPVAPIKKNLDSPPCTRCGSITIRNGSCHLCTNCGITTGCS